MGVFIVRVIGSTGRLVLGDGGLRRRSNFLGDSLCLFEARVREFRVGR